VKWGEWSLKFQISDFNHFKISDFKISDFKISDFKPQIEII